MESVSLVTGGAGFVGSHVVEALLARGERLVVLDDLSGGFAENVPPGVTLVTGSIVDHELVDSVFRQHRVRRVYHLAAYAAEGLSHFIRRFNYQNNLIGSVNLINASVNHEVECFVFTSSIAVYGPNQVPMHEELVPTPEDPYGIAKLAVEQDLRACHAQFGLPSVIFRPHNVYGERQNIGDRYRNVIGIFMNQIMGGEPMTIFGDGSQTRAFTYAGDIAPVIAEAAFRPAAHGQVFNVGADTPYPVANARAAWPRRWASSREFAFWTLGTRSCTPTRHTTRSAPTSTVRLRRHSTRAWHGWRPGPDQSDRGRVGRSARSRSRAAATFRAKSEEFGVIAADGP